MSGRGNEGKGMAKPRSYRAGLQFPVGHTRSTAQGQLRRACRCYLVAVMEYLAAEVIESAANAARDNNWTRITPVICIWPSTSTELNKLPSGVTIVQSGVLPNIQAVLLPKNIYSSFSNLFTGPVTSSRTIYVINII